jgi:hypothetical protein
MVLAIISIKKRPDKFELSFKKYRRFKSLFQKELEKETLPKY